MLEAFFKSLAEWVLDLVEADELFDFGHLGLVAGGAAVQTLDDGAHVTEDGGVHECFLKGNNERELG